MLVGQPMALWGDGSATKDYLYVADLVAAVAELMAAGFDNEIYNIGSGEGRSLRDIIAALTQELGLAARAEHQFISISDVRHIVLATAKTSARTGGRSRMGFGASLRATREWMETVIV